MALRWRRPHGTTLVATVVVLLVLFAVVGGVAYRLVRNSSAPPAVALEQVQIDADVSGQPLAGRWAVEPGQGFVGYRVFEPLGVTVVGRTTEVSGALVVDVGDGVTLRSAEVSADLGQLGSDAAGRDRALRTRILETDRFPTATFLLTEPAELGRLEPGVPTAVTATGTLTVRELTQPAQARLEVRWDGPTLRVVGSVEVTLSAFGVDRPSAAGVDSIKDEAVVEIDLSARPSAGAGLPMTTQGSPSTPSPPTALLRPPGRKP